MQILIKQSKIVDSASSHNGKTADVLVENGIIKSIKANIAKEKNHTVIEADKLHLSNGWFDMQVNFCDPGYEHKETLESGMLAAASGGFTGVALVSSTLPPIHSKAEVLYIKNKTKNSIVDVFPVGSVTHQLQGDNLSEMYDMHLSGAIAFSDDKKAIDSAGLLTKALLYTKNFDGLVMTHCNEKSLSQNGKMNEGITSTQLGLKGIPALAEELMIMRNIQIAKYTDAPIHILNVSTAQSVALIKHAKVEGVKITASVNAYNLAMDDTVLLGFDSNYKLNPPLRTKEDCKALLQAVADGTIDAITSDHRPQDIESKNLEFDLAENGMIGLETAFALINSIKSKLKLETMIDALTINPRKILKIESSKIEEGEKANLTFFNPNTSWTFKQTHIKSKSVNTSFIKNLFKGKALGVINNNQLLMNTD